MSEIEKLGITINNRIHQVGKATEGMKPEVGTITSNLGLQVNSVSNIIPKGDYLVTKDGVQAGDRVLVVWCGYEPVVCAVLVES